MKGADAKTPYNSLYIPIRDVQSHDDGRQSINSLNKSTKKIKSKGIKCCKHGNACDMVQKTVKRSSNSERDNLYEDVKKIGSAEEDKEEPTRSIPSENRRTQKSEINDIQSSKSRKSGKRSKYSKPRPVHPKEPLSNPCLEPENMKNLIPPSYPLHTATTPPKKTMEVDEILEHVAQYFCLKKEKEGIVDNSTSRRGSTEKSTTSMSSHGKRGKEKRKKEPYIGVCDYKTAEAKLRQSEALLYHKSPSNDELEENLPLMICVRFKSHTLHFPVRMEGSGANMKFVVEMGEPKPQKFDSLVELVDYSKMRFKLE